MISFMKQGSTFGNWLVAALAFLLSGALSVAALSILRPDMVWKLRGTGPTPTGEFRIRHPVYHHALKPGVVARLQNRERRGELVEYRVNSLGMRDRERAVPKPPGTYRVLMLGDSFIEGYNVGAGESVSVLMENRLNDKSDRPVEVINGGCVSYSPILHYLFLRETGSILEPDLVVLNLDMSDIQDDIGYGLTAEFDGEGRPLRVENRDPRGGVLDFEEVFRRLEGERKELYTDRYFHTRGDAAVEELLPAFERTWSYVRTTYGFAAEIGASFLLVTYPYGHQVDGREWKEGRKRYGFGEEVYEGPLFGFLDERSGEEGIAFLNLLDGFRSSPVRPLFFDHDGHWNEEGHALAARLIGDEIVRRSFIGAEPPMPAVGILDDAAARLAAGDPEGAWVVINELLERERSVDALNLAGRIRSAVGDIKGAQAFFEEALAVAENPESLYRLGFIALRGGDRGQAEEYWRNTVKLEEHFSMVDYNLGILYVESGRAQEALPHLRWAAESGRTGADGWNALGIAFGTAGKSDEAKEAFRKALEIDPEHGGARTNLELIQ